MNYKEIGDYCEQICKNYLINHDYNILESNYYSRYGEIDIIAKDSECMVFVEVKARKIGSILKPLEAVDKSKMIKIIKTAYHFLANDISESYIDLQPRFDVFEIYFTYHTFNDDNNVIDIKFINHIKNAFDLNSINLNFGI